MAEGGVWGPVCIIIWHISGSTPWPSCRAPPSREDTGVQWLQPRDHLERREKEQKGGKEQKGRGRAGKERRKK